MVARVGLKFDIIILYGLIVHDFLLLGYEHI